MKRNPAAQGRPDANHAEVRRWYEELFCSFVDSHGVGGGFGDAVIGIAGITDVIEIKTEAGELLPSQVTFRKSWRGSKVLTIRTRDDVIAHVLRVRGRFAKGVELE